MQYSEISRTTQAKAAISGLGFSSQAHYQAWDILCKKFGRPSAVVESELKKTYTHHPVRHDYSSGIIRFENLVTNKVNGLNRLGFLLDMDLEVLSSATEKLLLSLNSSCYGTDKITD